MQINFVSPETIRERVASIIGNLAKNQGETNLLISGGSVQPLIAECLVKHKNLFHGDFHVYFVDERADESNYNDFIKCLKQKMQLNGNFDLKSWFFNNLHQLVPGNFDLYDKLFSESERTDFDNIHGVIIGMGEDGHIASLFPMKAQNGDYYRSNYQNASKISENKDFPENYSVEENLEFQSNQKYEMPELIQVPDETHPEKSRAHYTGLKYSNVSKYLCALFNSPKPPSLRYTIRPEIIKKMKNVDCLVLGKKNIVFPCVPVTNVWHSSDYWKSFIGEKNLLEMENRLKK